MWADPDDRNRFVAELSASECVRDFESQVVRKDGVVLDVIVSSQVMEIGGETCILSVTRDVTDRKRADESLRRSEERYRALSSHTPDHVVIQDADLRYT